MPEKNVLDEIEVIDLEEYACSGNAIPNRVKYYLIRVDKEKFRVQSPITAEEILIVAGLKPAEYVLVQKFHEGKRVELEADQIVDLREPGVERFKSKLTKIISIIVNGQEHAVQEKHLSFMDLVVLGFGEGANGANVCFTIGYRRNKGNKEEGSLVEGETVKIKEGMIFNVTRTDKS